MGISVLNSVFLTHNICGPLRKAAEDISWKNRADVDGGWGGGGGAWLPEGSWRALGGLRVLRAGMGYKCMKLSLLNSVFLTHNICGPLRKAAEDISWKNRADVDGGWGVGGRGSRRAPGGLSEGSECSVQEWVISVWNCYCFTHNTCGPFGGGCREHFLKKRPMFTWGGGWVWGLGLYTFYPPFPGSEWLHRKWPMINTARV